MGATVLHRELDALADAAATEQVGDPAVLAGALEALAGPGASVAARRATAPRRERLAGREPGPNRAEPGRTGPST